MKVAKGCIAAVLPSAELVGDKGYCSNELRAWLVERGEPITPSKRNHKVQIVYDLAIYKQRDVIERILCRITD